MAGVGAGGIPREQQPDGTAGGRIRRVSGPLVEISGLPDVSMLEVVALGPDRISAETIAVNGNDAVLQAYEYTGGLKAGDSAEGTGRQLSALLGPHLLGQVFDGLLRPLSSAPLWLSADREDAAEDHLVLDRQWKFEPQASVGDTVTQGQVLGIVPEAGSVPFRVTVPPGIEGELTWLGSGMLRPLERAALVGGTEINLATAMFGFNGGGFNKVSQA